jgi:hypothetical protein
MISPITTQQEKQLITTAQVVGVANTQLEVIAKSISNSPFKLAFWLNLAFFFPPTEPSN